MGLLGWKLAEYISSADIKAPNIISFRCCPWGL